MDIVNAVNKFYLDMTINELRLMNKSQLYPNITYNTLLYLDIIYFTEKCTVSFLAQALNVSKPAVTTKVNELIAQELVTRAQSNEDRRVYYLQVHDMVMEEFSRYDTRLIEAVKYMEQYYSKEQMDSFCQILNMVSTKYSEAQKNEKPFIKKL